MPILTGAELAGWLRDAEQQDVCSFQDADIHHKTAKELPGSSVKVTLVLACQWPVTGCMAIKSLHTEAGERKAKIWQKLLNICFLEHIQLKKQGLLNLERQKKHNNKFTNLD